MGGLFRRQPYREIGHYTVPHGASDIRFDVDYPVKDVLLAFGTSEFPVCQGDLNWYSLTLLPEGFIVHARVSADFADLTWATVEGRREDHDPMF